MDKEQARFILRSFRPDGADVNDADFAEALALAMENRELGEWLAKERAFDADFAEALGSVDLPENLREDIFACLAAERGDFPQAIDETDALIIGALATLQPPPFLRDELIAAMDRTAENQKSVVVNPGVSFWKRAAIPLAAAAGIALAFLLTRPGQPSGIAHSGHIRSEVVQASFIKTFESPTFDLEKKGEDHLVLIQHLKDRGLPFPERLPRGLENVKGVGCRELLIDGGRGSVICFNESEQGVVHLVMFNRDDMEGNFPERAKAILSQDGRWASAKWESDGKVYILMGTTEVKKLATLL